MRNLVSIILLSFFTTVAYAQNKSLGVGTATPSPNAALHVESPTNNQGAMLPRLTTAQRTAMTGILGTTDAGLLLYDTDIKSLFSWDGSAWKSPGANSMLPLSTTLSNDDLKFTDDALGIAYTGDSSRTLLSLHFANATNPNVSNPFRIVHEGQGAAMVVTQSNTLGTGGVIQLTNPGSTSQAFRATTLGTGQAGNFRINNVASTAPSLFTETNGSGAALSARNTGVGNGFAGLFTNTDAANTYPAIQAGTQGPGPGLRVIQNATSIGGGLDVIMQNTSNTAPAVNIEQQGLAASANFNISNATNNISTINANTSGTGSAAYFSVNNVSSTAPGIFSQTSGTGPSMQGQTSTGFAAIYGRREGATNGNAGLFDITDVSNAYSALQVNTVGTGSAGNFEISNAANNANAVQGTTNGPGNAVAAINNGTGFGVYARATGATDAVYAVKQGGDGTGSAGNFQNQNTSNGASTLFAMTNAGTGTAIGAINSANGNALAIFTGGLKVSTATLNAGTSTVISTRAMAYFIEDASSPFTFSGGVSLNEGDMIYIFNGDAGNATIDGFVLQPDHGVTAIYMAGNLRFFAYMAP